jgi:formate/nitrite transporter
MYAKIYSEMDGYKLEKRMVIPSEITDEAIKTGVKKAHSSPVQLLVLGALAGMFIALGAYSAAVVSHSIDNYGISKFAAAIVFPVGLMLVLICGGELFTGNTLMLVAFLEKKIKLKELLRNWGIVYFSNLIGAIIIGVLLYLSGALDVNGGKLAGYAIKVAALKGGINFWQGFASGIICNILVCIAVWGAYAAKDIVGKIFVIWFPVMAFILTGTEHCVANMYYFSAGMLAKINPAYIELSHVGNKIANISIGNIVGNLIPVTFGNIVGGSIFVGMLYWLTYKQIPRTKASAFQVLNNKKVDSI